MRVLGRVVDMAVRVLDNAPGRLIGGGESLPGHPLAEVRGSVYPRCLPLATATCRSRFPNWVTWPA